MPEYQCSTCGADDDNNGGDCRTCGGSTFFVKAREAAAAIAAKHVRRFNEPRRCDRDLSEMLGLAKGLLADGVVNDDEARFLRDWGANHPDALTQWPLSLIFTRLQQFYLDGQIDNAERAELQSVLADLVGGTSSIVLGYEGATTLPLDVPPPVIQWTGEVYVFTGQFAYGPRNVCEREVMQRGGKVSGNVTKVTSFVVIGTFGNEEWAHSSFGRKIQKAVEYRETGIPLKIIGEDHWANALAGAPA